MTMTWSNWLGLSKVVSGKCSKVMQPEHILEGAVHRYRWGVAIPAIYLRGDVSNRFLQ